MRSPADLAHALSGMPQSPFLGTLYRRVPLVSLFGAKRSGARIVLTRVPPEFLYAGGSSGRTNRFTYVGGPLTLYLAADEATAQAETADGLPLGPTAVYGVQANLRYTLDLTDTAVRRQLGTSVAELTGPLVHKPGDPLLPTHVLAQAIVESHRFSSIRYPSARRRRGGVCLSVYPGLLSPGEFIQVQDPSGVFSEELVNGSSDWVGL
jgi:RES domain-containing protein